MNGGGCKTCPVKPCYTLYYRGSYCMEERAKLGLGDPQTIADQIRSMNDEELAAFLYQMPCGIDPAAYFCKNKKECGDLMDADKEIPEEWCKKCLQEYLQRPAEEG